MEIPLWRLYCDCSAEETIEALGLNKQYTAHTSAEDAHEWDGYITLSDPPPACAEQDQWTMSIYRGIVPLKCLFDRDFAINGGTVSILTFIVPLQSLT